MKGMARSVVFVACAAGLLGLMCDGSFDDRSCCATWTLTVRVVDADTGIPVTNATVTASDGATTETLSMYSNTGGPCGVPFADYRGGAGAGAYTVRVEAEGYETAVIEDILVPEGTSVDTDCPFIAVDWLVELTAAP